MIEDQALVDGRDVQITAVQREFQRSGTGRVTLELRPAQNVTSEIPTGDLTVTIPTRLNESDWESKTDLTDSPVDVNVTDTGTDGVDGFNIYNLTLNTTPDRLTVDTVGVQQDPDEPTQNDAASIPDGSGSGGGTGGGAAQNVEIDQVQFNTGNGRITVTLRNNNPSEVEVTQASLDSYDEDKVPNGRSKIDRVIYRSTGPELIEDGPLEQVNGPTIGSNGGTQNIKLFTEASDSTNAGPQKDDVIVFTLEFDNDSTRQYTETLS